MSKTASRHEVKVNLKALFAGADNDPNSAGKLDRMKVYLREAQRKI